MTNSKNVKIIALTDEILDVLNGLAALDAASVGKTGDAVLRSGANRATLSHATIRLTGLFLRLQRFTGSEPLPPLPVRRLGVHVQRLNNALSELLADGATAREQQVAYKKAFELLAPTLKAVTLAARAAMRAERRRVGMG